jgi:hypothetical protein
MSQYAQTHNIPVQSLYYWRSYLKRMSAIEPKLKPAFTPVVRAPAMDFCIKLQMVSALISTGNPPIFNRS